MPFEEKAWRDKFDREFFVEKIKETECGPDEGGVARVVIESVFLDDTDIIIEREVLKYFKNVKIKVQFNPYKELRKLWLRRVKTLERQASVAPQDLPKLINFDPNKHDIPNDLAKELKNPISCEEKYYGFAWIHELERSPDYRGNLTFEALRNNLDAAVLPVELKIKSSKNVTSKKGTTYRSIVAEDVTGQENRINIWADDWKRWAKEFAVGNLLRVRLQPPSNGFNTFTLESNQLGKYRGQLRYRDKDDDPRVFVMSYGKKEDEKFLSDDEVMEQFKL